MSRIPKFNLCDLYYHTDADDQLRVFVHRASMRAIEAGERARAAIRTVEDAEGRKRTIRDTFLELIGGLPESCPLEAEVTGRVDMDLCHVEKVIFQSRPKEYVTSNFYIPKGLRGPTGAVLFLCGHYRKAKHHPEYQRVCLRLAGTGLAVLAIDPIGQGERLSYYDRETGRELVGWGGDEHDHLGAQCLLAGRGLAAYFVHDAMRAVDYLRTRPEVDPERIGVTGNSGGGTQTAMLMMADMRIKAAAPGTFITDRRHYMPLGETQCLEQVWPGFTARGLDYADMLIAMAPRPVLVLATVSDFFPIEGTRCAVAEARRVWALYGCEDALRLFEDDVPHQYSDRMAEQAAAFFALHLNGAQTPAGGRIRPVKPEALLCTRTGQVLGDRPDARTAHDANADRADQLRAMRGAVPPAIREPSALQWLREKVYSDRIPCALNVRRLGARVSGGLSFEPMLWWSQEDLFGFGILLRLPGSAGRLPVTIGVWDGGTSRLAEHAGWVRGECAGGRCVLALDVSGAGALAPNGTHASYRSYRSGFVLSLCLLWLGDSLPALRTWDVLRAAEALRSCPGADGSDIRLYGFGRYGLYCRLAAALDSRLGGCTWENGFDSFESIVKDRLYDSTESLAVALPGVLEHFDLPELGL